MDLAGSWNVPAACFGAGCDESGAGGGHCVRTLRQLATAPRRRCSYAGIRRHVQTMLWVRACHSAMVLTLSMLRTRNCVSPRLRAWALAHSAVAARSL